MGPKRWGKGQPKHCNLAIKPMFPVIVIKGRLFSPNSKMMDHRNAGARKEMCRLPTTIIYTYTKSRHGIPS
jgi:hypothetical protein